VGVAEEAAGIEPWACSCGGESQILRSVIEGGAGTVGCRDLARLWVICPFCMQFVRCNIG